MNFRWFTKKKAKSYGVIGWIRNTDDGKVCFITLPLSPCLPRPRPQPTHKQVEGEAQGSASKIESLRADLKQGPRHAQVTGYEEKGLDCKEEGKAEEAFEVVR